MAAGQEVHIIADSTQMRKTSENAGIIKSLALTAPKPCLFHELKPKTAFFGQRDGMFVTLN